MKGILAAGPTAKGRAESRLSRLAQPQHSFVMVGATTTNDDGSEGGVNGILGAGTATGARDAGARPAAGIAAFAAWAGAPA